MRSKFLTVLATLIMSSCMSVPHQTQSRDLSFGLAKDLFYDCKVSADVLAKIGKPSGTLAKVSGERWNYIDAKTGNQRLSLMFDKSMRLESVLWIPSSNDPEKSLDVILTKYPELKVRPIETRKLVHSINTETTYSDDKSISILHNDYAKRVEAIAWFSGDNRRFPTNN